MKVCFFTGSQSLAGGTERACASVAGLMAGRGYSVDVLSLYNGKKSAYPLPENVCLRELYQSRPRGLRSILGGMIGVWRDVLTRKPEVLVAVESMSFLCFLMVLLMPRRPALVCWEHFNASITLGLRSRHFARKVAS